MGQFCQYGLLMAAGCILYVGGMEIEDDYRPHPSCTNDIIYGSLLVHTVCQGDTGEPLILPENFNTSRFHPQLWYLYLSHGVVKNPFTLIPTIYSEFRLISVFDFNLHPAAPRFPLNQLLVYQKTNLQQLSLRRVKLVEITASDFLGFHMLHSLHLYDVHITSISSSVFEYLGNVNSLPPAPADKPASLEHVAIVDHNFDVVDWSFLKPIANSVKNISLYSNRITAINSSSHFTLTKAETVALVNNEPPTIPAAVFNTFDTNGKTLNLYLQQYNEHPFCPQSQDCSCCELQPFMQWTRDHNMTSVVKNITCGIEGLDGLTVFSTGPIASEQSCPGSRQTTTTVTEEPSTTALPSEITTTMQITLIAHTETNTVASLYDDPIPSVKDAPLSEDLIGGITAGTVGLFILITIVVFFRVRTRNRLILHRTKRIMAPHPPKRLFTQCADVSRNSDDNVEVVRSDNHQLLEVPAETVQIGKILGRGEYGIVYQGLAHSLLTVSNGPTVVAVKCTTDLASQEQNQLLVEEYKVMLKVGKHVNVLDIVGIMWDKPSPRILHNPPFLVLEYCPFGSLRDYLRGRSYWDGLVYWQIDQNGELQVVEKSAMNDKFVALCAREGIESDERNKENFLLSNIKLMNFIGQICRGMQYLHSRNVIHRDLAARNVLVADGSILKICDFGLARHAKGVYTVSNVFVALPILWMPPEAILTGEFSPASDVWSFGIVLWEIFSLGQTPFHQPDVARFSANAFAEWLMEGNQMVRPNLCPLKMYKMMLSCWYIRREDRPTFSHLLEKLMGEYLPLEDRPVGTFDQFNAIMMNHLIEDTNL